MFKKSIEELKPSMAQDWETNWAPLEQLYGQKSKLITELKNIFTKEFGPTVYSVLSCGKVEEAESYVLAIIQEQDVKKYSPNKQQEKKQDDTKAEGSTKPKKVLKVLRVYWL